MKGRHSGLPPDVCSRSPSPVSLQLAPEIATVPVAVSRTVEHLTTPPWVQQRRPRASDLVALEPGGASALGRMASPARLRGSGSVPQTHTLARHVTLMDVSDCCAKDKAGAAMGRAVGETRDTMQRYVQRVRL